jgi:hypothetical protein
MDNVEKNKYFLLLRPKKIKFVALKHKNEILFTKEILINSSTLDENFWLLENFLDQNIIEIEKNLKSHIKDLNLIIDDNNFIMIDMSSTHNFKNYFDQSKNITNSLIDLKNNLKENIIDYEIIHMLINKFIVGEKSYSSLPVGLDHENIFLEIRFICLKINIYLKFKKIFSKYQISIKNILYYEYVNTFKKSVKDNIFDVAEKMINGLNHNEVLFVNKTNKNKGFFEKFFNFFG